MRIKDLPKISNLYIEAADKFCVQHVYSDADYQLGYERLASLVIMNASQSEVTTHEVNEIKFANVHKTLTKVTNLLKEELTSIEEDLYTFLVRNSKEIYANCVFVTEGEREFNVSHYGAHLTSNAEVTVLVTPGEGKTILGWKNGKLHLFDSQIKLVQQDVPLTYANQMFLSRDALLRLGEVTPSLKITTVDSKIVFVERVDVLDIINHFSEVNFILYDSN